MLQNLGTPCQWPSQAGRGKIGATMATPTTALPTRHRRRGAIAGFIVALGVFAALLPSNAAAATVFRRDVYFSSGYERQVDNRTCTAASTAMMLNFVAGRDLGLNQLDVLRYAQARDALNDATQRGSDPLGWSRALTYYAPRTGSAFTYNWEAYATEAAALKRAAAQLALTGRPAGILTMNGRHAVVMTGFEAIGDPRRGPFTLTNVWISDPIAAKHSRYTAAGSPLDRYLELDATATYDKLWYGKYIVIVPQGGTVTPPLGSVVLRR